MRARVTVGLNVPNYVANVEGEDVVKVKVLDIPPHSLLHGHGLAFSGIRLVCPCHQSILSVREKMMGEGDGEKDRVAFQSVKEMQFIGLLETHSFTETHVLSRESGLGLGL